MCIVGSCRVCAHKFQADIPSPSFLRVAPEFPLHTAFGAKWTRCLWFLMRLVFQCSVRSGVKGIVDHSRVGSHSCHSHHPYVSSSCQSTGGWAFAAYTVCQSSHLLSSSRIKHRKHGYHNYRIVLVWAFQESRARLDMGFLYLTSIKISFKLIIRMLHI